MSTFVAPRICQVSYRSLKKAGVGVTTNGSSTSIAFINPASDSNHYLQGTAMGAGFPRLSSTAGPLFRKEKLSIHL